MPLVRLSAGTVVRLAYHSRISVRSCILIGRIQIGVQNTVCALGTLWESGTSLTGSANGATGTISAAAGAALVFTSSGLSLPKG
jgi:hypothetical protein